MCSPSLSWRSSASPAVRALPKGRHQGSTVNLHIFIYVVLLRLNFYLDIKKPGDDLLSHRMAVPSALEGLTSVFGMGTGGTPPPLSPGNCLYVWFLRPDVRRYRSPPDRHALRHTARVFTPACEGIRAIRNMVKPHGVLVLVG